MDYANKIIQYLPKSKQQQRYMSIFAAVTLLYATYKIVNTSKKKTLTEGIREIPVPEGAYPIFGHMLTLGNLPGTKIKEWHRKYGPIIQIKMGIQTWIMVDDPLLLHKILVSHGVDTSNRPYSTYGFEHYSKHGNGIAFSQPGSVWQRARAAALTVLAPKQVMSYFDQSLAQAEKLALSLIKASEDNDNGINPHKYLELCAMNYVLYVALGKTFDSIHDPEFQEQIYIAETSMALAAAPNDLASFVPMLALIDYIAGSQVKMKKFISNYRNPAFEKLIKAARAKKTPNLVKTLDESDLQLSEDELLVLISDFINGGTDTTAITMLWNFAIMCHHPETQEKVAKELDDFIRSRGHVPTFKDRDSLPYCVSVMKECMRYAPTSAFGLPHAAQKTLVVDGYLIPKDATIISSMESIHSNPRCYTDPETFIPDRFMDNLKTMQSAANGRLEDRDHYNFGWGRRICPGIYMAEVEMFNVFAQVFSRVKIEPANPIALPDIKEAESSGVTINPKPYFVKFIKRPEALV